MTGRIAIISCSTLLTVLLFWSLASFGERKDGAGLPAIQRSKFNDAEARAPGVAARRQPQVIGDLSPTREVTPNEDLYRIEIRRKTSGEAVPGAELFVCELRDYGTLPDRPRRRAALDTLRRVAARHVADAGGVCAIPRPGRGARLYAFTEDASGSAGDRPVFMGDGKIIEVSDDQATVRVRTIDCLGKPVGGIPIFLCRSDMKTGGTLAGRTEEVTGELDLPLPDDQEEHEAWLVRVGGVFHRDLEAPIAEAMESGSVIELRLPSVGAIEIEFVGASGSPFDQPIQFSNRRGDRFTYRTNSEVIRNGRARIAPVEVGIPVEYWFNPLTHADCRPGRAKVAGPTFEGETIRMQTQVESWASRFALRVLDPSGEILSHASLSLQIKESLSNEYLYLSSVRTDADGRIEVGTDSFNPKKLIFVQLRYNVLGDLLGSIHGGWRASGDGARRIDLGDFRLEEPAFIASGRVVDALGNPVPFARFEVASLVDGRRRSGTIDAGSKGDADGRFLIRGDVDDQHELELSVRVYRKLPLTVPIHPGVTDLVLVMEDAAQLRGKLDIPEDLQASDLTMTMLTSDGQSRKCSIQRDGRFDTFSAAATVSTLELQVSGGRDLPSQVLANHIELRAGEICDLGTIPVTLAARRVRLTFEPAVDACALVVLDAGTREDVDRLSLRDGATRILFTVPRLPVEIFGLRGEKKSRSITIGAARSPIDLNALFAEETP